MGRLTYKQEIAVCELLPSKYHFNENDFSTNTSHFSNTISETFHNILLLLSMAKRRHGFKALLVRILRKKINHQKVKFALTCRSKKVIRRLAFGSREKVKNSSYFKIIDIVG